MINKIFKLFFCLIIFSSYSVNAAFEVTVTDNPDDMVSNLVPAGEGVTVTNAKYTGDIGMSGTFTGAEDIFGTEFHAGVILSTGNVKAVQNQQAPSGEATQSFEAAGDSYVGIDYDISKDLIGYLEDYLNATNPNTPIVTNDASVLEFDFETVGDTVSFKYIFASEEYNKYVDYDFNDAFALFINGENVALVKNDDGTNDVVSIKTINNNKHSDLFKDNDASPIGSGPNDHGTANFVNSPFVFNGYTVVLTAEVTGLDVTKIHHMKFVIADVDTKDHSASEADTNIDSAVFIQADSFITPPVNPDNIGTDFLFAYLPNTVNDVASDIKPMLYLTTASQSQITLTVKYPSQAEKPIFQKDYILNTNEIITVDLSKEIGGLDTVLAWTDLDVDGNRIYKAGTHPDNLVSVSNKFGKEFVAYMHHSEPGNGDASMGIPTDVWGTEYIVSTYFDKSADSGMQQFIVYANEDDTRVEITASGRLITKSGASSDVALDKGQSQTITLDKGEAFYAFSENIKSSNTTQVKESIAGTIIKSTEPVGVIAGNRDVIINGSNVDSMFEILPPTITWGSEFLTTNLPNIVSGSDYQILASRNRTTIKQDGVAIAVIDKNTPYNITSLSGEHRFTGEDAGGNPVGILGMQYMTSEQGSGLGDPAMGYIVPTSQFMSKFYTAPTPVEQYSNQYLGIISQKLELPNLKLNGVTVDASQFAPHVGTYSWANIESAISQSIKLTQGFSLNMIGQSENSAYLYPAGALLGSVNSKADVAAPICSITSNAVNFKLTGSANDKQNQEATEDLNDDGLLNIDTGFVDGSDFKAIRLAEGSLNLKFDVTPYSAGDLQVSFDLEPLDKQSDASGVVLITDAQGNSASCDVFIDGQGLPTAVASVLATDPTAVEPIESLSIEVTQGEAVWFDARLSSDPSLKNSGGILSYQWDLIDSDGTDSADLEGELVQHTYTNFGDYTATLTVWDNSDPSNKASTQVTIKVVESYHPPVADLKQPDNGKEQYDFKKGKVTRLDASGSHAAGSAPGEGISYYDWNIYKKVSTPELDADGNPALAADGSPKVIVTWELTEARLRVEDPIQDFIMTESGEYRVELTVYDTSGKASEQDPDKPSVTSEINADVYDQQFSASGSLGLFSGLFLFIIMVLRRKTA